MSNDLISRLDAIDALEAKKDKTAKGNIGQFYNTIIQHDIAALIDLPTIDAVEVVHGEWLRYGEDGNPNSIDTCIWQCDQCLETYYGRTTRIAHYCPNCGAKMDGERKDPCS